MGKHLLDGVQHLGTALVDYGSQGLRPGLRGVVQMLSELDQYAPHGPRRKVGGHVGAAHVLAQQPIRLAQCGQGNNVLKKRASNQLNTNAMW